MQEQQRENYKVSGLKHWWHQKITAILLLPLTLWFIICLPNFIKLNYNEKLAWINYDLNFILISLFFIISSYHMKLGLNVVFEDYIHNNKLKKIFSILVSILISLIIFLTLFINAHRVLVI